MIVRVVKMTFQSGKQTEFEKIFSAASPKIRSFEGCLGLKLFVDHDNEQVYFTYSHWESLNHLNNYRSSGLFNQTWKETKVLFADKAEAWSLDELLNFSE